MAASACSSADHRRFDFWLGEWIVHGGPGGTTLLGHRRIERSADGCRLLEHWHGTSGVSGESLNAWDAAHRVWRQFWVGGDGVVLRLQGDMHDGAMVMTGELPGSKGGVQLQRITWTPAADGNLTQQWDVSDDQGASWQSSFRGTYRRSPTKRLAGP